MMQRIFNSRSRAIGAALAISMVGSAGPGFAQEAKQSDSAWVKLCEKGQLLEKGKDGKPAKVERRICLTTHERLDANTGLALVSVALRQVEGQDKDTLLVMVPLGMRIKAGVRAIVLKPDEWKRVVKKEKIDESKLKPLALGFELCHAGGCTAEHPATPELIDSLKKGGGLLIMSVDHLTRRVGFEVSLNGFTKALQGKPVDSKAYAQARGQVMAQIRERQKKAYEQYLAKKKADAANGKAPADGKKK